jgi:putative ATP-binding cassette transporter
VPLLHTLIRASRRLIGAAALASLIGGVCSVLLVATINNALSAPSDARRALLIQFSALALFMVVARIFSGVLFSRLGQATVAQLRLHISQKVIDAPYRHIEQTGPARIHSLLTDDANNVATFFVSLPVLIMNAAIVIGCFAYLSTLSLPVFAMACGVAVVGSVIYHLSHVRVFHHLQTASVKQDELFSNLGALVTGAKELRLNCSRANAFVSDVLATSIDAVRRHRAQGLSLYAVSASWGYLLFFALIGAVVFFFSSAATTDPRVATGYAIVFLFLMVPLEVLINSIPQLNLARVSLKRIEAATQRMQSTDVVDTKPADSKLRELELRNVTHFYYHEREDGLFKLGPVDLSFRPGEISFLVGGNGSGKTTLAKLLVGLYVPESGATILNGVITTDENRARYRQTFAAIFSDFHLFESLGGIESSDIDGRANEWLERLHLNHKVSVSGGKFSTRDLSHGQRKRLALVVAYLEDRPFLVFDEWAADQDPQFKEVFYHSVLADLKSRGKSVLVISHDERSFHVADRVIQMENGRIIERNQNLKRSVVHVV